MNIDKAFQRLSWRLSSGKFEPNQNDVDALTFLADWVNREKEEKINQNRYFGKMVIYTLIREIEWLKDTKMAESKIHHVLKMPLAYWYDRYRMQRVMRDFQETMDVLGIEHFYAIWDKHKDENGYFDMAKIKPETVSNDELFNRHKSELEKSLTRWEQPEVTTALNHMLSELLNEYGNMP